MKRKLYIIVKLWHWKCQTYIPFQFMEDTSIFFTNWLVMAYIPSSYILLMCVLCLLLYLSCSTRKPSKWHVHPANSDQPAHSHNLISLRCVHNSKLRTQSFFMWTAKTPLFLILILILIHSFVFKRELFTWLSTSVASWCVYCFLISCLGRIRTFEPQNDKTNTLTCAPSKDSDQHGHPPSLISLHCALNR